MDIQKTALRLPQDLHQQVIDAAHVSGRSMNAEIIARLRATFADESLSDERLDARIREIVRDEMINTKT